MQMGIQVSFDVDVGWSQIVKSFVYQVMEFSFDFVDSGIC